MKTLTAIIFTCAGLLVPSTSQVADEAYPTPQPTVRFAPVHIYIDTSRHELAAFQFELRAAAGQIKIVGVEGGDHAAFKQPPYYDPAALANHRIIIAAFSTEDDLAKGRTKVATVHLQIIGAVEPQYQLNLTVAADPDGEEIPAEITFEKENIR